MTKASREFVLEQVTILKRKGKAPHIYKPTEPYDGCLECGQGSGAFQHNTFLVQDYEEMKAKGELGK